MAANTVGDVGSIRIGNERMCDGFVPFRNSDMEAGDGLSIEG